MIDQYINRIICADSLEIMQQLPDKSIDLVLTDPPYGINIAKNGKVGGEKLAEVSNYGAQSWDNIIPEKIYFDELIRVSKNQIIFGGNYFIEYLTNTPCFIVWDKNNTGNFADCELAWTSFKTAVRKYKFTWNGMLQENMKNKEKRLHPTQKPVYLFTKILNDYSKENDIICDPFAGSGTTAMACYETNRRFICIEKEQKYCDIAEKRLRDKKECYSLIDGI